MICGGYYIIIFGLYRCRADDNLKTWRVGKVAWRNYIPRCGAEHREYFRTLFVFLAFTTNI